MMRVASLLLALSLLSSAATAYAECAWVLWETITTRESNGSPGPVRATRASRTAIKRSPPRWPTSRVHRDKSSGRTPSTRKKKTR